MNNFIVANPRKCIGCKACEIACAVAHLDVNVTDAAEMDVPYGSRLNVVRASHVTMPIQCRQCEDAPCAAVCPEGAIAQIGNCNIADDEKCIGCKKCLLACPFGVIDITPNFEGGIMQSQAGLKLQSPEGNKEKARFVVRKCDLCAGRASGPACIEVCPADAFTVINPKLIRWEVSQKRTAAANSFSSKVIL